MTQIQGGAFPRNFLDIAARLSDQNLAPQVGKDLNDAFTQAYQSIYTVQQNINNASVAGGITTVTGSKLNFSTGLTTVLTAVVSIDAGAAPSNLWTSVRVSPVTANVVGAIDIFVWQPTAAGNTAPTAALATVGVRWIAFGSK